MPFPLDLDGNTFEAPPALAAWVFDAAKRGQFPERRLDWARREGRLSRDEAVGLAAALVQTADPVSVATGARFAVAVGDPALARLLAVAAEVLDVGTLLTSVDEEGTSVEDLLLAGAVSLLGDDADVRASLLVRLRNAGLAQLECQVLCTRGSPDEIAAHLPSVLVEGLPAGGAWGVATGLSREEPVREAILEALKALAPAARMRVYAEVASRGLLRRQPELETQLLTPS